MAPGRGGEVERLLAPVLPLGYLLAVEAVWRRTRTRPALVAALLLVLAQPGWTSGGRTAAPEVDVAYERIGRWLFPLLIMLAAIWLWDRICVWNEIPQYILPRPGVVLRTLWKKPGIVMK